MISFPITLNAFILLTSISLNIAAQKKDDDIIKITGRIRHLNNNKIYSKAVALLNKSDWFTNSGTDTIIQSKIDSNGNFHFNLPNLNKPYKINIVIKNYENHEAWQCLFYTEPKDNIALDISQSDKGESTAFYGKGAEKYKLAYDIDRQFNNGYFPELRLIKIEEQVKDSIDLDSKMDKLHILLEKYNIKKAILIKNSNVNLDIKKIINYEYGAYARGLNFEWTFRSQDLYYKNKTYRNQIAKNYLLHNQEFFEKPEDIAKFCPFYIAELADRDIFELMIMNSSEKIEIKQLYDIVKTKYSGVVRDRVLGYVLTHRSITWKTNLYSLSLIDSLLKDASKIVALPYVKKAFVLKMEQLSKINNSKVIEGRFEGIDGKTFNIRSLSGKVFLIDIWFNGCSGCISAHKDLEKYIYPKFKDNKNFVVLSINIDREKQRWTSGIESKLYTSNDHINVTTSNWLDHPFLKYYNVKGAPWFMVVDSKGKIVYQPNGATVSEMSRKISEALNQSEVSSL